MLTSLTETELKAEAGNYGRQVERGGGHIKATEATPEPLNPVQIKVLRGEERASTGVFDVHRAAGGEGADARLLSGRQPHSNPFARPCEALQHPAKHLLSAQTISTTMETRL
ncbi:unnamed protein product [Boreogadus saida]